MNKIKRNAEPALPPKKQDSNISSLQREQNQQKGVMPQAVVAKFSSSRVSIGMAFDNQDITARLRKHFQKYWPYYLMILIPLLYYIVFRYVPIAGNIVAFRRYRAGSSIFGDEWSGLKYFNLFWNDNNFWRSFQNTLILNISYLLVRFPLTLIFALLLNEIRQLRWKKFVQTASYLPHFISIVIVAGMVRELVSTDGPINRLIEMYTGSTISFISLPEWFPTIYVVSGLWQSLGWGTILYLAAMSNISPTLYEAAQVDGAGRFRQAWSITLPLILPTISTLLILDIGGLVGSGMAFEKIFLLYNPLTYETADVISTYVFRVGITSGNYSYATAINLFEGLINLMLLSLANLVSRKVNGTGLW